MLSDQYVLDAMLSDKFYMQTFGALEFLPELKGQLHCRKFLQNAKFKTVVSDACMKQNA